MKKKDFELVGFTLFLVVMGGLIGFIIGNAYHSPTILKCEYNNSLFNELNNDSQAKQKELLLLIAGIEHNITINPTSTTFVNPRTNHSVTGLSFSDWGYFVVTQNRTIEEIQTTECHEETHQLIKRDYDHFCKIGS